jgi:hypothetical protein
MFKRLYTDTLRAPIPDMSIIVVSDSFKGSMVSSSGMCTMVQAYQAPRADA